VLALTAAIFARVGPSRAFALRLEQHPWIALNLYSVFAAARAQVLRAGTAALASHVETGIVGEELRKALAADPMAYGVKATRTVLETIASYVNDKG
jgi:hypothetical protein